MLGKLFKSKKAPQNSGELITQSHISNLRLKKVFELELANMEGSPCYRLTSKLGFGSEIGEILISDDSISPRHCTFTLEQDVITLIDHNSVTGTLLNNTPIEAGKSVILDESDEIKIGELLIKIKTHNEAVVREKKAALAVIPEVTPTALMSEEDAAVETEQTDTDSQLVSQLSQLDEKFQDDTNLKIEIDDSFDLSTSSSSSKLLEERGIDIHKIVSSKASLLPSSADRLSEENKEEKEENEENLEEGFEVADLQEVEEELDEEMIEEEDDVDEEDEEIEEEENEAHNRTSAFRRIIRKFKKKKKYSKSFRDRSQNAVVVKKYAANTILRLVALHIDLCLAYGTYLLISPFDDFKELVATTTVKGQELIAFISSTEQFKLYEKEISFILEMFKDLWMVIDNYINPIPTLIIFALSKLIFTFLLGVSLGQFLVGIKASGNVIWKRLGGVIRTVIGFFTFPFLIFDLGAIISRRTVKEFITFTRIYSDSKVLNILLSIIFLAVSGVFVLMAPMFQGFEPTARYEIPKKVEERVIIQDNHEETAEVTSSFSSRFLDLKVELTSEFEVYPGFKFEGSGKKTNSQFILNIYDKKMEGSSQIELVKNFDFKQLLEIGFKGNPFLKLKFPHIDNFIHQHTPVGFKRSVLDSESFAQEFMEFHRIAMDMSLESYFDHIAEVPVVGSLLNYKQSFLALFDNPELNGMSFVKMGDVFALKIGQNNPKAHDFVIPILPEGKIFKFSFNGEKTSGIASRLYRYALYQSHWTEELEKSAFDHLLIALQNQQEVDINDAQALYGYYYELSQKVFTNINNGEYQLLRRVVKSVLLLISGVAKEDSEALLKLEANFKDLADAVEVQNLEYFNLTDTTIL